MTNATRPRGGSPLGWVTSALYSRPAATGFSVRHTPALQFPALAMDGRDDLWSLCPFKAFRGQTNIIYDVKKAEGLPQAWIGFDVRECYAVRIYVMATS